MNRKFICQQIKEKGRTDSIKRVDIQIAKLLKTVHVLLCFVAHSISLGLKAQTAVSPSAELFVLSSAAPLANTTGGVAVRFLLKSMHFSLVFATFIFEKDDLHPSIKSFQIGL